MVYVRSITIESRHETPPFYGGIWKACCYDARFGKPPLPDTALFADTKEGFFIDAKAGEVAQVDPGTSGMPGEAVTRRQDIGPTY